MKIIEMRAQSIRCFDDIGTLSLNEKCNVFVGSNNAGKSTLLRIPLAFQGFNFDGSDIRRDGRLSGIAIRITIDTQTDKLTSLFRHVANYGPTFILQRFYSGGDFEFYPTDPYWGIRMGGEEFAQSRPNHDLVPFLAKRRAAAPVYGVDLATQSLVNGTVANIVSRVDLLAVSGHPSHDEFAKALKEVVGLKITTKATQNGKVAGFYLDADNFVSIESMGDGITEMVAMIVELVLERGKVFIIEEPEANLHPKSLKALLALIRKSSKHNQFLISTHSNIVLRELSAIDGCKIFNVSKTSDEIGAPSIVEEVDSTPEARIAVLRDLGYEFGDFDLHAAWLFLEESSAESVFRDVLIPMFVPELAAKLRTFSAGGVTNLEPRLSDFHNLFVFLHMTPAYLGKVWVRADGDDAGSNVVKGLRAKFKHLTEATCSAFSHDNFESYYPNRFQEQAAAALAMQEKKRRADAKRALLLEALVWTKENSDEAKSEWARSAQEPIALLQEILRGI